MEREVASGKGAFGCHREDARPRRMARVRCARGRREAASARKAEGGRAGGRRKGRRQRQAATQAPARRWASPAPPPAQQRCWPGGNALAGPRFIRWPFSLSLKGRLGAF